VGEAFPGGDVAVGQDSLVIPDVVVLDRESARQGSWVEANRPVLAIEVLSPVSARADRVTKRRLYQEMGVPAYWLVDADARVVEAWTPEAQFPVTEREEVCWHPQGAAVPLVIRLGELFRDPV
jgi:Uma2 family endonuclease